MVAGTEVEGRPGGPEMESSVELTTLIASGCLTDTTFVPGTSIWLYQGESKQNCQNKTAPSRVDIPFGQEGVTNLGSQNKKIIFKY
jgi:hypothetical protein